MQPLPLGVKKVPALIAALSLFCVLISPPAAISKAPAQTPATVLEHQPVAAAQAGKIVPLTVKVKDESGIAKVRFYYKTMSADRFVFVQLEGSKKDIYIGNLPPAKNDTKGVDYFILVKNGAGETIRSKSYRMLIHNDYNTSQASTEEWQVYSEHFAVAGSISDFAVRLKITPAGEKLLADAIPYKHQPITVPGPAGRSGPGGFLSGVGGAAASITLGGMGVSYKSSSGN